jgi:hypothetical protein
MQSQPFNMNSEQVYLYRERNSWSGSTIVQMQASGHPHAGGWQQGRDGGWQHQQQTTTG